MGNRLSAVFGLLFALNAGVAFAASRDTHWKEVDDAIKQGLPKTAIEKLDPIIQGALKDKAWDEATMSIARKIVLEGNKPEEKIVRMEAVIVKAPKEIVPLQCSDGVMARVATAGRSCDKSGGLSPR